MSESNIEDPSGLESDRETASRIVEAILNGIQPAHEISPSGELYRVIGRYHRVPRTALYSTNAFALPIPGNMSSDQDIDERQTERNENESSLMIDSRPSIRGLSRPSRRHLSRLIYRNSSAVMGNIRESHIDLQHAGHQLEQASSNLRALLDDPVAELPIPISESNPVDSDFRRVKRRKLNSDNSESTFTGFTYGKFGQVEPGKLKMEIVSCDGGILEGTDMQHPAENVLENDNTVYCTKSNRCNLILQHQGATVFCLKELCIKAPHSGYTAPVQEGMVFISMTSDDLLTRTAQYQIQYSPYRPPPELRNSELTPILSIRRGEDGAMTTAQNRARRLFDIGRQDEECDYRTAQIPQDFTLQNPQPFIVTTECSDSDGEDTLARSSLQRSTRLGLNLTSSDDSESNEDDEVSHPWHENYIRRMNPNNRGRRSRQRGTARNMTISSDSAQSSLNPEQDSGKAVDGGLMAPHARFFIERDKSKCTVKFEPPVSGRFILLKMWSPHHDVSGNIDIQSVVAIGFAGPRYFPAIKWI
ncbi:putative regulator of chromosome condensation -like protein [Golovinomyces cichoracearum]|uniref:Putative regulator of chromosome condensation-like protein n=1 Tax=Golovinomyces cichoracearum TaxID=62708 RepID=A0A420J7K4_9PEZI|nr:putative regulator of chromosome condensation -like protein [Golovinomyces cichoracearum]